MSYFIHIVKNMF